MCIFLVRNKCFVYYISVHRRGVLPMEYKRSVPTGTLFLYCVIDLNANPSFNLKERGVSI
nr:MAG TPA_asm: hypothetical protein [Caudoviricetes sp.]